MDGKTTNIERVVQRVGRGMEPTPDMVFVDEATKLDPQDWEKLRSIGEAIKPDAATQQIFERLNRRVTDSVELSFARQELFLLRSAMVGLLLEQGGRVELSDYQILSHRHSLRVTRSEQGFSLMLEAVPDAKPQPEPTEEGKTNERS